MLTMVDGEGESYLPRLLLRVNTALQVGGLGLHSAVWEGYPHGCRMQWLGGVPNPPCVQLMQPGYIEPPEA